MMSEQQEKMFELIFKILSALIIPILLWVNNMSVSQALMKDHIENNKEQLKECKREVIKVQLNSQSLEQVKKDIDHTTKNLEEIRKLILNQP